MKDSQYPTACPVARHESNKLTPRIGFIGIGSMGLPTCANLLKRDLVSFLAAYSSEDELRESQCEVDCHVLDDWRSAGGSPCPAVGRKAWC